ncbi:MAG TPA: Crp/Fnr family transcriptional regulator [Oscillospiraceae bacterium]|nr:Crp/Fnr family transcriptional regulator [Oscillospiraceae bacterium]HPS34085.1 Crp/Fnr family transcriptional regulator [Oscillospiraceae bacterium]
MQYEKLLNHSALLRNLSQKEIQSYLNHGQFRFISYGKNTVIHLENELCTGLEVILSGKIAIERIDESGGLLTIAEFSQGDLLGGNLLFSKNGNYPMTVAARQSGVILKIEKQTLLHLFSIHPDILLSFLEYISDHAFILSNTIKRYVNKTIRESLIEFLKGESKKQGSDCVRLNMTKKALADQFGVQRTSLSRELAKMKQDGLILFDQHSITLL